MGPTLGWPTPTEAFHGCIQSLSILIWIKVWEVMDGASVHRALWREKQRVSPDLGPGPRSDPSSGSGAVVTWEGSG